MAQPFDEATFRRQIGFLRANEIYYIADRAQFDRLNDELKSYAVHGHEKLMDAMGIEALPESGEVLAFSSELEALHEIQDRQKKNPGHNFMFIVASPLMLFQKALELKPKKISVDEGLPNGFQLTAADFEELPRLLLIAQLSLLPQIGILEDGRGEGLRMDIENETFAIGVLGEVESAEVLKAVSQSDPDVIVSLNKTYRLVDELLASQLAGLVLNPGLPSQDILAREDLEKLKIATEVEANLLSRFKKLFDV